MNLKRASLSPDLYGPLLYDTLSNNLDVRYALIYRPLPPDYFHGANAH